MEWLTLWLVLAGWVLPAGIIGGIAYGYGRKLARGLPNQETLTQFKKNIFGSDTRIALLARPAGTIHKVLTGL